MTKDDKLLHVISNETKDSIDQLSIVTPSIFASIFSKFAKNHKFEILDENSLSQKLLQNECSQLTELQTFTSKNMHVLSNSTHKAISAIHEKDETKLNEVLKETEALRNEIEKLKESLYKDELTNTYNRKWLHDNFIDSHTHSFKDEGALAIIDLNYFKIINDMHGHIIGDKVLILVANELQKSKFDVLRYGGDEFIILFPKDTTKEDASLILNKIRENILSKKLKAHDTIFRVSFSIGISEYKKDNLLSSVIEKADKRMYEDKQNIKKRITGIEI